jgi:5-oxoprolinase (ATP-hydrolysing)
MYVFNVDRGGTFTDFYVQEVEGTTVMHEWSFKVPSVSAEGEGPIVGIRKFLVEQKCMEVGGEKIPIDKVKCINLGTTIATNALLERKGVKNAIIMSEGFSDLLEIKHQARPNIFDLSC